MLTFIVTVLMLISDGDASSLIIEWEADGEGAVSWQYRIRGSNWDTMWPSRGGQWQEVPGSTGDTRSYRITGLEERRAYDVQVRPITADGVGDPSNIAINATRDSRQAVMSGLIRGDGVKRWTLRFARFTVVVPDGMLVRAWDGRPSYTAVAPPGLWASPTWPPRSQVITDHLSGSKLRLYLWGAEIEREMRPSNRDVDALFDELVDSVRRIRIAHPAVCGAIPGACPWQRTLIRTGGSGELWQDEETERYHFRVTCNITGEVKEGLPFLVGEEGYRFRSDAEYNMGWVIEGCGYYVDEPPLVR